MATVKSSSPRHVAHIRAIESIALILGARPASQRQMLLDVLDVLENLLQMSRGTVMLLRADGQELLVEAARDLDPVRQSSVTYRTGEGVTGKVAETGRTAVVPRIGAEPAFLNRLHSRDRDVEAKHGFICAPIQVGDRTLGTLAVDLEEPTTRHLEVESRFLGVVASLIAGDVKSRNLVERERTVFVNENLRLRDALEERFRPENIIGNSRGMRDVYTRIYQVAESDTTVLVRGETGTGKELVASAIHYTSPRAKRPFVKVNCAALSESLLESELFGHEKGAFTGALYERLGRIEEAEGGTLFLDEIGDFSPAIQVKLLRVLQEREYERVGSNRTRQADVRIIAATNRNLEELAARSEFRQDLYYRINVFPISIPPLRERRDDILLLADHFVQKYARKMGRRIHRIGTPAINMMAAYHWPGNVRELENCLEHAVLLAADGVIHGQNLPPTLQTPSDRESPPAGSLVDRVRILERDMITDALKRSGGIVSAAARELGITQRQIRYKIKNLQIEV